MTTKQLVGHGQRGFTLIELLVVIAIIAILISLLVPAVQKVRESAARLQCANNLKQLALAIHSYHDANKKFPMGGFHDGTASDEGWGWGAYILPYVEQSAIYTQMNVATQPLNLLAKQANGLQLIQTPLAVFRCPSDTPSPLLTERGGKGNGFGTFHPAKANYIAICGGGDTARLNNGGIMFLNSAISFGDIEDGSSNTFLVGERNTKCYAGAWVGNRNPNGNGWEGACYTLGRTSIPLNAPSTAVPNANAVNGECEEGFASTHSGGANFAMGDGTVRFVSTTINFNNGACFAGVDPTVTCSVANLTTLGTYQKLGLRNDGQTLGSDF